MVRIFEGEEKRLLVCLFPSAKLTFQDASRIENFVLQTYKLASFGDFVEKIKQT